MQTLAFNFLEPGHMRERFRRNILQFRVHQAVPAVEPAKQCDHRDNLQQLGFGEELSGTLKGCIRRCRRQGRTGKRLQQLRGVGPSLATALVATVGDASQFANGRQMAASLGLTPRQSSSGGKERLLGISKRGDSYLRMLLVHGARSVIRTAKLKNDRLSQWVMRIASTRHPNIAAVALANKTTRIAWAMMAKGTDYQPDLVAT